MHTFSLSSAVFLLALLNVSYGLPPARRYGYNDEDHGYRGPGMGARFGPRYGQGSRSYGDTPAYYPFREREPARPIPVQRLPPLSRAQGPTYFNYRSDDEALPRFARSGRVNTDFQQSTNDFNDVGISDIDDGGVNVGGVSWPRRTTTDLEATHTEIKNGDCDCDHHKVASLAKDATAAAANAASAAALAAKAAAVAAAAAACSPDGYEAEDAYDIEREDSVDINSDVPLEDVLEYPNNSRQTDYQEKSSPKLTSHDDIHTLNGNDIKEHVPVKKELNQEGTSTLNSKKERNTPENIQKISDNR